jgi:putative ABC transport system ATP-binding protein
MQPDTEISTGLRAVTTSAKQASALLLAAGITRTYQQGSQQVDALRGVGLHINAGEFVALIGPSGSGKSTLLHLLSGLDRPDAGEVVLEGKEISNLSERELAIVRRRRFGFVLQFYNLLPTLSAEENVAFPLLLDSAPDALSTARERLADVGLSTRAKHLPHELSGGEQQRVGLARAIIGQPAVVFADEPTGNLDSKTGAEILALLRRTADSGQAIIMATHDQRAASYVDRVVALADGQIDANTQPSGE